MTRTTALAQLLVSSFSDEELRAHLASEPEAHDLTQSLPGKSTPLKAFVAETVTALERRGLLDRAFFDRLEDERPRRREEIRVVRNQWLIGGQLVRDAVWGDGRYTLESQIGGGGIGLVWRAVDNKTREYVALKVLLEHHADDRRTRQRFFRGASVLAHLTHSAIVQVRSEVVQEGPRYYFVMELLKGENLESLVATKQHDPRGLLEYVFQVGLALHHVHSESLLHRDVKPSNILVTTNGRAKLIDFDLVTGDGFVGTTTKHLGSGLYAPPEATTSGEKTPAYDVFGLARTVEYVLRGGNPQAHQLHDTTSDLAVSPSVKAVLRAALHPHPSQRIQTVASFCKLLREALAAKATVKPAPLEARSTPAPQLPKPRSLIAHPVLAPAPATPPVRVSSPLAPRSTPRPPGSRINKKSISAVLAFASIFAIAIAWTQIWPSEADDDPATMQGRELEPDSPIAAPPAEPVANPEPVAPDRPPSSAPPLPDIIETLRKTGRHSKLLAAIEEAGLTAMLEGQDKFTIFAPVDDAFNKLRASDRAKIKGDRSALISLVKRHIFRGSISASQIGPFKASAVSVAGTTTTFDGLDGFRINATRIVIPPDLPTSNGVVHTIDTLIPAPKVLPTEALPDPPGEPAASATKSVDDTTPSVACILDRNKCTKSPLPEPPRVVDPSLPENLDLAAIKAGTAPTKDAAERICKDLSKGGERVKIKLSINGPLGKVIRSSPDDDAGNPQLASCVARELRNSSFARIQKEQTSAVVTVSF